MSTSGSASPSVLSDEERNSSNSSPNTIPPDDASTTIPLTPDDISRWQCHINLETFGQGLHAAAKAVFPNTSKTRYKKVSVLMLCWDDEDPNLPVSDEIKRLDDVFKNNFGFDTNVWKIPGRNSHAKLTQRILDLIDTEDDPKDHLFIVYYGGHAKLTHDRLLSWTSWRVNRDKKYPTVQWSGVQNVLEQAESDVLILLDCCHAATATTSEGNGVTEMISACAYNAIANGVGYYSFTKELTIELRELSRRPSFPVADLFRNVFSRIQARRPEDGRERHPAPVHLSLTQDNPDFPRSIQLSVRPGHIKKPQSSNEDSSNCAQIVESDSGDPERGRGATPSRPAGTEQLINDTTEAFPAKSISKLSAQKPRILLAVRLRDDCRSGELSVGLFKDWLRDMPAVAEEVKVEAGFGSFSSIVIISIPLALSIYMPRDPAIIKIGPITSGNLLQESIDTRRKAPTQECKSRLISAVADLKSILLPDFPEQLQLSQSRVIGIIGMKWYIFVVGAVTTVRLVVKIALDMISHYGIIKLAGILSLLLVAISVILEVTNHYTSISERYCLLTAKTVGLWAVHFHRRAAPESSPHVPGVPFNSDRVGSRPSHSNLAVIAGEDLQSNERADAARVITPHALALQKRVLASETGSTPKRTPQRIKSHNIVTKQNTYIYKDIDCHREIRLLKIIHGAADAPLEGMIFTSALPSTSDNKLSSNAQTCTYTALSYHWGQDEPQNQIRMHPEADGRSDLQQKTPSLPFGIFYVQDNLNAALRQFRDTEHDVIVWVDIICINQGNRLEKMAQAARMHKIYKEANNVCVWLGTGTAQTKDTFQFLRDILDLQTLDRIIEKKETEKWMLVINLMKKPWFSRFWVIQELALAKRAYVRWGEELMEWLNFADAIALFMTKYDSIKEILKTPDTQYSSSHTDAMVAQPPRWKALVDATGNNFRRSDNSQIQQRL
ncbi:hypothetical protein BDZ45DRAFT_333428 [Acephala macrosclerotiorum]|nr:hypothetical protein BDZ45DRAFT_333428 [Acephala macrosclerotiorum]